MFSRPPRPPPRPPPATTAPTHPSSIAAGRSSVCPRIGRVSAKHAFGWVQVQCCEDLLPQVEVMVHVSSAKIPQFQIGREWTPTGKIQVKHGTKKKKRKNRKSIKARVRNLLTHFQTWSAAQNNTTQQQLHRCTYQSELVVRGEGGSTTRGTGRGRDHCLLREEDELAL